MTSLDRSLRLDLGPWRRRVAVATVVYAGIVAFVVFQPSNAAPSSSIAFLSRHLLALHVPALIASTDHVDVWTNVLITAPLAAAFVLLWPRVPWERWVVGAFAVSTSVELVQGALLPARVPSYSDVVANTAGVLLGAGGCVLLVRVLAGRGRAGA